jgi:hypothetical protein
MRKAGQAVNEELDQGGRVGCNLAERGGWRGNGPVVWILILLVLAVFGPVRRQEGQ